jgi:hypothetical protein
MSAGGEMREESDEGGVKAAKGSNHAGTGQIERWPKESRDGGAHAVRAAHGPPVGRVRSDGTHMSALGTVHPSLQCLRTVRL